MVRLTLAIVHKTDGEALGSVMGNALGLARRSLVMGAHVSGFVGDTKELREQSALLLAVQKRRCGKWEGPPPCQ